MSPPTFAERLERARQIVELDWPDPPTALGDQLRAANRESEAFLHRLGAALRRMEPSREWTEVHTTGVADPDARAHFIAAMTGCMPCVHLRRRGVNPQPTFARLPLHQIDCARCVQTFRKPPPGDDHRCDWCGTDGVQQFTPMVLTIGAVTAIGDGCDACAAILKAAL